MAVKIFLDTNATIHLLKGNREVIEAIAGAENIQISVINELEFKSFSRLSLNDTKLFDDFASIITVLDLKASDMVLKNRIIEIRNAYNMKLPDAIVAASAIIYDAELVTADKGFRKVKEITLRLLIN